MPSRQFGVSTSRPVHQESAVLTKKANPLGTDPALTMPTAQGKRLPLTYWDVWFALVAVRDFGSDLTQLAQRLVENKSVLFYGRDSSDRKRSRLRDLQARLTAAGLTVDDVVTAASELTRTEFRRARKRVLEPTEREREWSEPMRNPPRKRLNAAALRGAWPRFPVSPEPYAEEIRSKFKTSGFYGENASFGVARKLDGVVERANKLLARKPAEAQAMLRAWLTVVVELMEMADDSFGRIGDSFHEGFAAYLKVPLEQTGIDEAVFFGDLLSFLIWEDYGLTWRQTEGYFKGLTTAQADWCINYLRQQIDELRAEGLFHQGEEALTLLGQVVTEQERFDEFEALAREMGARAWVRIIRLADKAMKRRKRPLACQVFEAALTAGPHLEFLRKKYDQLQQGKWNPDPKR